MYQMQLVSGNTTNIESLETEYEERKAKLRGETYQYQYDRGFLQNFKEVLGSKYHNWLIPTPPEGDGLSFPTNEKYDV